MKFMQSYYTDVGNKRSVNQDSLALLKADTEYDEVLLAVICDGMGGYESGELASKTVIEEFVRWFKNELPEMLYDHFDYDVFKASCTRVIRESNRRLVNYGNENGIKLGSTVTAFFFVDDTYYAAHVGDSRGYEISENSSTQITDDHSLIAYEVRKGILTEELAKKDKRKNKLVECVGITERINIDFYSGRTKPDNTYVLCTDGFWHKIPDEDLIHYLSGKQFKDNEMLKMHLNYLVEQAKLRDETDNISVLAVIPK